MPELDSVRGLAVLMVLCYHGIAPPVASEARPAVHAIMSFARFGWVGVNLFFVLSGFLITGILLDSRHKPDYYPSFYLRRFLRIVPALYLLLAALRVTGVVSWPFALLSGFMCANFAPLFAVQLQYGPLWSLAVEEHFYLLWPAFVRRLTKSWLLVLLCAIFVFTPAIRAVAALMGHCGDISSLYTWFNLDGLALGGILALLLRTPSFGRLKVVVLAWAALASSLLMLIGGNRFGILDKHRPLGIGLQLTAWNLLCAAVLLAFLLLGTGRLRSLANLRWLRSCGAISYGLYLYHVLLFWISDRLFSPLYAKFIDRHLFVTVMMLRFAICCAVSIAVAYASRSYFEEIFLRMKNRIASYPQIQSGRMTRTVPLKAD